MSGELAHEMSAFKGVFAVEGQAGRPANGTLPAKRRERRDEGARSDSAGDEQADTFWKRAHIAPLVRATCGGFLSAIRRLRL